MLAGARARAGSRGLELVVPHPAGVGGVYILNQGEIANYCVGTVHDLLLSERIGRLTSIAPRDIRQAARAVAKEGAAGRPARDAAVAAESQERQRISRTSRLLLQLLVRQTGGGDCPLAELERHGHAAVTKLAPALGRPVADVAAEIATLACHYAELGLDGDGVGARCRRVADEMDRLHPEVTAWADRLGGVSAQSAMMVAAVISGTLTVARQLLADSQARAGALPALLAMSFRNAAGVARELERAEWLLDGWEPICLIWHVAAEDGARRATVAELLSTLPMIPTEAAGWAGSTLEGGTRPAARPLCLEEDWRTQHLVAGLIVRNEHLRALAA